MDFTKGEEYCHLLQCGEEEKTIAAKFHISFQELYNVVDYADPEISRTYLKHFCNGYINYVCLCWPNCDEHLCPVFGFEPECPLNKE